MINTDVERIDRLLFVLALLFGLAGPTLQLRDALAPLAGSDNTAVQVAGLVVAVAGVVATLVAQEAQPFLSALVRVWPRAALAGRIR